MPSKLLEVLALEFSNDIRWVGYIACAASFLLAAFATYVFDELSIVRPLLIFVSINGEAPPICGFCVLFGR